MKGVYKINLHLGNSVLVVLCQETLNVLIKYIPFNIQKLNPIIDIILVIKGSEEQWLKPSKLGGKIHINEKCLVLENLMFIKENNFLS